MAKPGAFWRRFSLEDFPDQLAQIKKMGSIQNLMGICLCRTPFAHSKRMPDPPPPKKKGVDAEAAQ